MKNVAYEAVYNQIMAQMEKGIVPWRRPWKCARPCNAKTGRAYNGINFFLLTGADFSDNRWLTYKQLEELGGNVKKGEKSRQVVFWQILRKEEDGKPKSIPLLKYFNVFNVEQTEGVDWDKVEIEPNQTAEGIVNLYTGKPVVKHGGDRACYIPNKDEVHMPPMEAFNNTDNYYATLYHELVHSTGHKDRLNRKGVSETAYFGDVNYSEEELIAEFGSAFLCNAAGIDNTLEQSAAYLQSWMKTFKDNPNMIVSAASKAQKAADYMMGVNSQE
jgi:antirestriction protein ArdC